MSYHFGANSVTVGRGASQAAANADYNCTGTSGSPTDTATIQSAINAVQTAGGGVVYITAGTYYLDGPLAITASNVCIVGEGAATVLYQTNTTADHIQVNSSGAYPSGYYSGLEFRDFVCDGPTHTAGACLNITGTMGCKIRNVRTWPQSYAGGSLGSPRMWQGIEMNGVTEDLQISACYIFTQATGIYLDDTDQAIDGLVENCWIISSHGNNTYDGISVPNGNNLAIRDCEIQNWRYAVNGQNVSGGIFLDIVYLDSYNTAGLYVSNSSACHVLLNNSWAAGGNDAVNVTCNTLEIGNCRLAGNIAIGSGTAAIICGTIAAGFSLVAASGSSGIVAACKIAGPSTAPSGWQYRGNIGVADDGGSMIGANITAVNGATFGGPNVPATATNLTQPNYAGMLSVDTWGGVPPTVTVSGLTAGNAAGNGAYQVAPFPAAALGLAGEPFELPTWYNGTCWLVCDVQNGMWNLIDESGSIAIANPASVADANGTFPPPWAASLSWIDANDANHAISFTIAAASSSLDLDTVSMTPPASETGWTNWTYRELMVMLGRLFFAAANETGSLRTLYADDGVTVIAQQTIGDDGVTQTQGRVP
jgi:Pectate lyase superfamily protein